MNTTDILYAGVLLGTGIWMVKNVHRAQASKRDYNELGGTSDLNQQPMNPNQMYLYTEQRGNTIKVPSLARDITNGISDPIQMQDYLVNRVRSEQIDPWMDEGETGMYTPNRGPGNNRGYNPLNIDV
jgi:hypothetical protein